MTDLSKSAEIQQPEAPSALKSSMSSFKHSNRKVSKLLFSNTTTVFTTNEIPEDNNDKYSQMDKSDMRDVSNVQTTVTITEKPINTKETSSVVSNQKLYLRERDLNKQNESLRKKMLVSQEDIDETRHDDRLKLLTMKRKQADIRQDEILTIKNKIMTLNKEYDTIHRSNERKLHELNVINTSVTSLQHVDESNQEFNQNTLDITNRLNNSIEKVLEMCAMETNSQNMLEHMKKRLCSEINICRAESAVLAQVYDQVKFEFNSLSNTYRLKETDYKQEEKKFNELSKTLKSHDLDKDLKLNMLQSILNDGDVSIKRVKSVSLDTQKAIKNSYSSANHSRVVLPHTSRKSIQSSRQMSTHAFHENNSNDAIIESNNLDNIWSMNQIREVARRYQTKDERFEKISQLQSDLQEKISLERKRADEFVELLAKIDEKKLQSHSNRDVYQELEVKEMALSSLKKEYEECREREHRLTISVESLRRCIPRLLKKLNKSSSSEETPIEKIIDTVRKLEEEVIRLIKIISSAIMKEASAEDLAFMANQNFLNDESLSELAKLQQLPGFEKMTNKLFLNLMTANPDTSFLNLRVAADEFQEFPEELILGQRASNGNILDNTVSKRSLGRGYSRYGMNDTGMSDSNINNRNRSKSKSIINIQDNKSINRLDHALLQDDEDDRELDRDTIKSISKLVIEKVKAAEAVAAAKQENAILEDNDKSPLKRRSYSNTRMSPSRPTTSTGARKNEYPIGSP